MIERKIIIGLITSTEYLRQIRSIWKIDYIESAAAKRLAGWVWEYFNKYDKAPGKDIEGIYYSKLKDKTLPKDIAEEIEEDILPSLSDEATQEDFNLEYLLDETKKYFTERHLVIHNSIIESYIARGMLLEAEKEACEYKPLPNASSTDLDLSSEEVFDKIERAFESASDPLIQFEGALGQFWNSQLVRGGFVAFMGTEKRGKTFMLLELAMKASKHGKKVAFFQAGDMTEEEQLIRVCIYLAGKSDDPQYCEAHWEPVKDCVKNQLNTCDKEERECDFGVFEDKSEGELRTGIHLSDLIIAYKENKAYKPCSCCKAYKKHHWGTPWIKSIPEVEPLTASEAKKILKKELARRKRSLRFSTYPNDTLTVEQIRAKLGIWEKEDGFIPEIIIVDYADLLTTEERLEERPRQNKIWKGLRRLSQEKGKPLVITVTQADAAAYDQNKLKLKNFSEDKRKYAHVTAMYGLNQDTQDREKTIGLMRINELVKRKGAYSVTNEVTILQNLRRGKPFIGSYL